MVNDRRLDPILITGGCGFLGRYLADDLTRAGYQVALFDIREDFHPVEGRSKGKYVYFKGDVSNLPDLLEAIRTLRINSIIHLAAVIPPHSDLRPYHGFRVNLLGTCHVLEAARLLSLKRITFASSGAVYGSVAGRCEEDASISFNPGHGLYGTEKIACELMGIKYADLFNFEFAAARNAAVYGAGGTAEHYLNILVHSAMKGQPVRLAHGGDHGFEFVHALDAADGIRRIHTAPDLKYRIYNVGTGKNHTLAQLAALIERHLPTADFQIGPGLLPHLPQRGPFDIARLSRLGYRPRFDLEEGLRQYIESMR
jgi:nucleoside-diphosphate-sugar epimerase